MNEIKEKISKNLPLVVAGVIFTYIIGSLVVVGITQLLLTGKYTMSLMTAVTQFGFLLLPTFFLSKKIPIEFHDLFRLGNGIKLKYLLPALVGFVGIQLFASGFSELQKLIIPEFLVDFYNTLESTIREQYKSLIFVDNIQGLLISLFVIALTPAICEEMFFRGLFQRGYEEITNNKKAIFYSAIVFAIVHINPIDIVALFIIGVFLGTLAFKSQSILLSILIHFLNNALAVFVLYYENETSSNLSTLEPIWAIIYTIAGALILSSSFYMLLKDKNTVNTELY